MLNDIKMSETIFRIDLNLQKLAMVSISTKLWCAPDARKKVGDYYGSLEVWNKPSNDKWEEISKFVVHYVDSLKLPSSVTEELEKIILIFGEKIQSGISYDRRVLMLPANFTEEIYSSYGGAIDETKILNLYSKNIGRDLNYGKNYRHLGNYRVFAFACIFGCERFINEHKKKMMDDLSHFYPQIMIGDDIYNIMSVSICSIVKKNLEEFVPHPRKMFELCLGEGFSEAARFYWERLDGMEKVFDLTNFAVKCFVKENNIVLREGCSKNLIYLINQMEEEEKCLFFKNYADKIIMTLLPVWPYQEFIVHLLRYDWDIESGRLLKMLKFITDFNVHLVGLECPVEDELFFQVFQKAWENITENEKKLFFPKNGVNLFLCCNISILNLVVSDSRARNPDNLLNEELITLPCLRLVKMGKFHIIDELIEKIFEFDPIPKEILKQDFVKTVMDLIVKEEFILIDKYLDWLSDSEEEEKKRLKNKINPIFICTHLTEGRVYVKSDVHALNKYKETERLTDFELAEKFLKWRFETDSEIKNFKERMKSYNFVMNEVSIFGNCNGTFRDFSSLEPGDRITISFYDEITGDNVDYFPFSKFEDTTAIDHRDVVMGGKHDDHRPIANRSPVMLRDVTYAGTKPGDYVVFNIYKIWKKLIDDPNSPTNTMEMVVDLCNAFIKFYYETDEEVEQFKRTKLQVILDAENVAEFLYNRLVIKKRIQLYTPPWAGGSGFNILNAFLKFCLIPSDKVEEIKIQLRNDFEKLMDNYLIDQCNFCLAEFCVGWLYDSFECVTKKEKMKNFINSSNRGALLCVSYVKKMYGPGRSFTVNGITHRKLDLEMSFRMWLKMMDDKEKLRNDLRALHLHPPRWLLDLFDDRK